MISREYYEIAMSFLEVQYVKWNYNDLIKSDYETNLAIRVVNKFIHEEHGDFRIAKLKAMCSTLKRITGESYSYTNTREICSIKKI